MIWIINIGFFLGLTCLTGSICMAVWLAAASILQKRGNAQAIYRLLKLVMWGYTIPLLYLVFFWMEQVYDQRRLGADYDTLDRYDPADLFYPVASRRDCLCRLPVSCVLAVQGYMQKSVLCDGRNDGHHGSSEKGTGHPEKYRTVSGL